MTGPNTPEPVDLGAIPIDAGMLLVVDPCHVPTDVLRRILAPNEHGVTVGRVVATPWGDGMYALDQEPGSLVVVDPHTEPDDLDEEDERRAWHPVTLDDLAPTLEAWDAQA